MLISVLVALLLGCAKVGPPTGGPVDKEPPRILSHYPESDALKVARDTQVEIVFSEPMNREQTEAALLHLRPGRCNCLGTVHDCALRCSWPGSERMC